MSKFTFTEPVLLPSIWSIKSIRSSTQRTSIRIDRFVSESTSNQNKLDEKVNLRLVILGFALNYVNYFRVTRRWRVDFLVAILLVARWFGSEMTVNPHHEVV